MMLRLISCTLLAICFLAVASGLSYKGYLLPDDLEGATYELNQYTKEAKAVYDGKNCTKPGFMCEDCKNVSICIAIPGGFIKEDADICPEEQTCLEATGTCTSGVNPDCDLEFINYRFTCHQLGMYPDALNCRKYHMCLMNSTDQQVIATPSTFLCESGYYYNAKTTLCDKRINVNGTCPSLGNPCKNATSLGPISGKPALYYVCLRDEESIYFPQIFLCPNNEIYNPLTNGCDDPSPRPAAGPDGKCIGQGLFYDPLNCTTFFNCTAPGLTPSKYNCTFRTHFNHKTQSCVDFTCADLD